MNRPPVVKQFCRSELTPDQIHFVVRLDHHCAVRMSHLLALYAEARYDFPQLAPEMIKATHYDGNYISGYFGIEFTLCGVEPPCFCLVALPERFCRGVQAGGCLALCPSVAAGHEQRNNQGCPHRSCSFYHCSLHNIARYSGPSVICCLL